MLVKFHVKNFKQFKDLTIDFSNIRDYGFNSNCLTTNGKLLKTIMVYGKNASGKSNLGYAIFDIVQHLFDKATLPEAYLWYLNADSPENPAEFSYEFRFGRQTVVYSYSKTDFHTVVAEELLVGKKLVFRWSRAGDNDDFSHLKDFGFETLNNVYKDRSISFLRYIANNSALDPKSPIRRLMDFVGKMLWFRRTDSGNNFIGFLARPEQIDKYIIDQHLLPEFQKFLESHDVREKLVTAKLPDGQESIYFEHKSLIPLFGVGSSGTLALAIFFYWKQFFDEASFIFIDEFDAFYHTSVAESIFKSLISIKQQVVLTTHNTNLLDHRITRPDCCFEIQNGELKSFPDLTERVIRQGNNLEKLYLAGEFNA